MEQPAAAAVDTESRLLLPLTKGITIPFLIICTTIYLITGMWGRCNW